MRLTQADILMYLSFCRPCHEKKKTNRKGIVTNPILHDELNSRCQVDLIDYQSAPSYDFKWVMVYQDHLTKFCILRALRCKKAAEVAHNLVDIFTILGASSILHSDNGKESLTA